MLKYILCIKFWYKALSYPSTFIIEQEKVPKKAINVTLCLLIPIGI